MTDQSSTPEACMWLGLRNRSTLVKIKERNRCKDRQNQD